MKRVDDKTSIKQGKATDWYGLFSRGARDWLRHNDKVRDSVRERLPDLIAGADVISRPDNRTVRVPVKFLQHYRFHLLHQDKQAGAGQATPGQIKAGDVLSYQPGQGEHDAAGKGEGGLEFVLELKVDDIVDWLWEELQLPNLEPKPGGAMVDDDYTREGWDKRGVRSRLDRRRTVKEAIKRRAIQPQAPRFTDEDLRYRQLSRRQRPATSAVIFFMLDASSSMREPDRLLAKTFFFWVLQGLRRQYLKIETLFIAHTGRAWEFSEDEFFTVTAQGGTEASSAFKLALEIMKNKYSRERYNAYLFYASDGDNFASDDAAARHSLLQLAGLLNFSGYLEIIPAKDKSPRTRTGQLFADVLARGPRGDSYQVADYEDIWPAIRAFLTQQALEAV